MLRKIQNNKVSDYFLKIINAENKEIWKKQTISLTLNK